MRLLELHQGLLADQTAQQAFHQAIGQTVQRGDTVLDLGTGTGIHALFACQAGAGRVYAVDQNPAILELARTVARSQGFADRIVFLDKPADEVVLAQPVDVLITHQGFFQLLELIPPARDRFLKKGGRIIPASVELFCAPLETPAAYENSVGFWDHTHYGFSFSAFRTLALNTTHEWRIEPSELLSESAALLSVNFAEVQNPLMSGSAECAILRPGILHGLGLWWSVYLTPSVCLSTAPPCKLSLAEWNNEFLPLAQPIPVEAGDRVQVRLRSGMGGWGKLWHWEMVVSDRKGAEKGRSVSFSLAARLLATDRLRQHAPDYLPSLTARGAAVHFILDSCQGQRPLRWIEEEVASRFPELFRSPGEAAGLVAELTSRYCA